MLPCMSIKCLLKHQLGHVMAVIYTAVIYPGCREPNQIITVSVFSLCCRCKRSLMCIDQTPAFRESVFAVFLFLFPAPAYHQRHCDCTFLLQLTGSRLTDLLCHIFHSSNEVCCFFKLLLMQNYEMLQLLDIKN